MKKLEVVGGINVMGTDCCDADRSDFDRYTETGDESALVLREGVAPIRYECRVPSRSESDDIMLDALASFDRSDEKYSYKVSMRSAMLHFRRCCKAKVTSDENGHEIRTNPHDDEMIGLMEKIWIGTNIQGRTKSNPT